MNCSEQIENWKQRHESLRTRLINATRDCNAAALCQSPDSHLWSPAQIVEHMALSHGPYLQTIQQGLERASKSASDLPIRYSFIGKLIIQNAGPNGNAPVFRPLQPRPSPDWSETLAEWERQYAQLLTLLDQAKGIDLSRVMVRNPLIKIIRMNLADCLEIITAHTERHVGQIEERSPQRTVAL